MKKTKARASWKEIYGETGIQFMALNTIYQLAAETRARLAKARRLLGWEPKVSFAELVRIMVDADLQALLEMRQCQDVIRQLSRDNEVKPQSK